MYHEKSLVERLRDAAGETTPSEPLDYGDYWNLCSEAADYIEELMSDKGTWYRMCELHCETIDRLKHSIREAMYLLDQPEPRSHAAFSELLCALNPKLREIQENMDERTNP